MIRRTARSLLPLVVVLSLLSLRAAGCRKKEPPPPVSEAPARWYTPLVTRPSERITLAPGQPTPNMSRVTLIPTEGG